MATVEWYGISHCMNEIPIKVAIRKGADKSLAFPIFLFAAQLKEFLFDGLRKLEQRRHKFVELGGGYVNTFFHPRSLLFSL
jgi:hypothetical protein